MGALYIRGRLFLRAAPLGDGLPGTPDLNCLCPVITKLAASLIISGHQAQQDPAGGLAQPDRAIQDAMVSLKGAHVTQPDGPQRQTDRALARAEDGPTSKVAHDTTRFARTTARTLPRARQCRQVGYASCDHVLFPHRSRQPILPIPFCKMGDRPGKIVNA